MGVISRHRSRSSESRHARVQHAAGRRVLRRRWLSALQWVALAVIPARLAAIAFLSNHALGWPVTIPGAILLGLGLARLFYRRERNMLLTQYQHLLGYLSTRLAAGIPLEAALVDAVAPMREQLGHHHVIVRSLLRLQKNLEAQMTLSEALDVFARELNLSVCRRDFTLLTLLARAGGRVDVFVRQSHHDLSAQINAAHEVKNEKRGQSSEAGILAVIPFVMARFILDGATTASYGAVHIEPPSLAVPLAILYLVAMVAVFIFLFLLAPPSTATDAQKTKKASKTTRERPGYPPLRRWLSRLYLDYIPGQLGVTISSAVRLASGDREDAWQRYMDMKTRDLLWGIVFACLLALSGNVSWFIVLLSPFLFSTVRDIDTVAKAHARREQYRFFYPTVVNTLYILLESGLTLDRALRMVARVSLPDAQPNNPVAQDLTQAALHLDMGYDAVMATHRLAERCPLPEVSTALRLIARYEREGGREILELIRMQGDRARQLYRDAMRARAERRALLYVLPMALDLIVVMATVILPTLASMRITL
jgi:Flp pilus assembly protein TadB